MIEEDRKAMVNALYSNGMIGGQELTREIESINNMFNSARLKILGVVSDLGVDEEFDENPGILTKAEPGGTELQD